MPHEISYHLRNLKLQHTAERGRDWAIFLKFLRFKALIPLSKNLAPQKQMGITGLMRRLSLIGIDAIWQLSLGCLLMGTIASFQLYNGYLTFINGRISRVILLHVQLPSCLLLCLLSSLRLKNHVIKYCKTVYGRNGKHLFLSIKNSGNILNKLKCRGFLASSLSTYDFFIFNKS